MSGFIPIVSSSPPPLDENLANSDEDDDWDDFAQFTGGPDPDIEDGNKTDHFFSPIDPPEPNLAHQNKDTTDADENHIRFGAFVDPVENEHDDSNPTEHCSAQSKQSQSSCLDSEHFASFQDGSDIAVGDSVSPIADKMQFGFPSDPSPAFSELKTETEHPLSTAEDCSSSKELGINGHQSGCRSEAQDVVSQGSVTDSGLSSDISPSTRVADTNEDFTAKIEHVVSSHNNSEDSGMEDQGMASDDVQPVPESSGPAKDLEHNQVNSNVDGANSGDKPGDGKQSHNPGMSSLGDSSSEKNHSHSCESIPEAADFESGKCSQSTLTCDGVSYSDPAQCDVSNTVQCDNCPKDIVLDNESLHRLDAGGDTTQSTDTVVISSQNDTDFTHPALGVGGNVESQDEFTEFKDALSSQVSDGDNEVLEPDEGGFHFKQHVPAGEDVSPVESLDLKLPATGDGSLQCEDGEWGDDFADFQDAGMPNDGGGGEVTSEWAAFGDSSAADDTGNNWASFNEMETADVTEPTHTSDVAVPAVADDDDFGDFEDVPSESFQTFVSTMANILQTIGNVNHIKKIISNVFNGNTLGCGEHIDIEMLIQYMEKVKLKSESSDEHPPTKENDVVTNVCVWNNLKEVSNTAALKYTWNNSVNRQKLLQACSIDTRNILLGHKKPSVPIFYQQTVLEPSRGPLEPNKPTTPTANNPDCLTPDTNNIQPTTPSQVVNASSSNIIPGAAGTPQDIPPAEFDWSSSGLTNPLDESSSIHLDLDFFVQKDSTTGRSSHPSSKALQQEQEILQALESQSSSKPDPPKTLQSIETLLAGLKFTPTAPPSISKKVENISREAQQILDRLPDLSFMNASVLMFPLKVSSEPSD